MIGQLDQYIIIETGSLELPREKKEWEGAGLRVLERDDLPNGVYAVWSDDESSVIAFLFGKGQYTEDEARAWLNEAMSASAMAAPGVVREWIDKALTAMFGPRHPTLDVALADEKWHVTGSQRLALADEGRAWSWTADKGNAIIDDLGWAGFARAHLAVDMSRAEEGQKWPENKDAYKLPVAELIDGKLNYVLRAAQAAYAALKGGRGGVDLPDAAKGKVLTTIKAIYKKFDRDTEDMSLRSFNETTAMVEQAIRQRWGGVDEIYPWVVDVGPNGAIADFGGGLLYCITYQIVQDGQVLLGDRFPVSQEWVREADGAPVMLHAFSGKLGDGVAAESADDHLIWKEIVKPGKWFRTDSGSPVEITADMIQSAFDAFSDGLPQYVSVPVDSHYMEEYGIVPANRNTGFVRSLKLDGDRLYAGFEFTRSDVEAGVVYGDIADCSVYLRANVTHPTTGEKYDWILQHVLLTNDPLVQGLGEFTIGLPEGLAEAAAGLALAGAGGAITRTYTRQTETEDSNMSEELQELLEKYQALGSPDDLAALSAQADQVREEQQRLAQAQRAMRIERVVRALEGVVEVEGITQIEGTRHFPAVITAVEQALTGSGDVAADSTADADVSGAIEAAVLGVVNAIPAEARLALTEQPAAPRERPAGGDPSEPQELTPETVTDEQIDALDETIGGHHTMRVD